MPQGERDTIRAFVAVPLPADLRNRLDRLRRTLAPRLPEVRWVRADNLHLTLRFFGDVPEESLEKLGETMLSVGRLHLPFHLALQGLGAFPAPGRARVFWLGVHDAEPLLALHRDLESRWPQIGISPDPRPFNPHLTLGRHRGRGLRAGSVLDDFASWPGGVLPVDRMVLYESRLRPDGAQHHPRRTVLLGTNGAAPADSDFAPATPNPMHPSGGRNPDG